MIGIWKSKGRIVILISIAGLLLIQSVVFLMHCNQPGPESVETEIPDIPRISSGLLDADFAGTESCIDCHEKEYNEWLGSHHDESMMVANDSTVKGDFDNTLFESRGVRSRFFKQDGRFMVNTESEDGTYLDYEILYTFGTEPLQQYIVKFPNGRYQCLRTAWDTDENKWFDLYPNFDIDLNEWLHWTNGGMNWNTTCADCHSTNLKKNYINEVDSFHTTFTILNVSCEACHGPSKEHIDFVNSDDFDSTDAYLGEEHMFLTRRISSQTQVDQCARCHSRRTQFTDAYNHEGLFKDHYAPEILRDNLYFADGQILDEDYVYSSFVQSKMYHNDVKCTNCHNPHTNKLKFDGNKLCLQCHEPEKYDAYEHHFHKMDSTGSSCVSCHMDGRIYMGNDYRRDHSFRVPRPDLSVEYEVPNSCISCHATESNVWARDKVIEWYGPDRAKNYADILCLGSTRTKEAVPELIGLLQDKEQPAIARATALWYLGFIDDEAGTDAILRSVNDPDPTVRYIAIEVMQSFPLQTRYQYIAPLLKDPIRSVRVMAFDCVTDVPLSMFNESLKKEYLKVMPEYKAMLRIRADFPGGQLMAARYLERQGRVEEAMNALQKATQFDTIFNAARINLAHLKYSQGNLFQAIDLFKLVIKMEPEYSGSYYSLGLLYAEMDSIDQAISYLSQAQEINPSDTRIYYNLGLSYQRAGNIRSAEKTFLSGLEKEPENPNLLYALAVLYVQQNEMNKALALIPELKKFYPDQRTIEELETFIRQN